MLSTLFFSTAPRSLPHIHTIISHQPTCIYKKLTPVFHCSKYSHRSPYAPSTVKLSLHTNILMTRQALNKQLVSHQVLKCNPTDIHPSETTGSVILLFTFGYCPSLLLYKHSSMYHKTTRAQDVSSMPKAQNIYSLSVLHTSHTDTYKISPIFLTCGPPPVDVTSFLYAVGAPKKGSWRKKVK